MLDYSVSGTDVRGPYTQAPPCGRFIYLNWGTVGGGGRFAMFRRAKLMLENVPNTHDSKRHQRASSRQTLVAETIVEPWLLGCRWDVICSHSKLSCSGGCRQ
jgi:Family of unknown function (DUF5990)